MAIQPTGLLDPDSYIDDSRYEFVDGRPFERPMPGRLHAKLQRRLCDLIAGVTAGSQQEVLHEWTISDGKGSWLTSDVTVSYPDFETSGRGHLLIPAYLVVEIRSVDQPIRDLFDKRNLYLAWQTAHYWLIDPLERACYEVLPEMRLCSDVLATDRFQVPVNSIFETQSSS